MTLTTTKPDSNIQIQLAGIALAAGAEITEADDIEQPGPNEIDLTGRCGLLAWTCRRNIWTVGRRSVSTFLMVNNARTLRRSLPRFATPSMADVRTAALQVRLMLGSLEPAQLPRSLHVFADLEQDVARELAVHYPPLVAKPEFHATRRLSPICSLRSMSTILWMVLTGQAAVNQCGPRSGGGCVSLADRGRRKINRPTPGNHALVELDGSGSKVAEGQRIVKYIWKEAEDDDHRIRT